MVARMFRVARRGLATRSPKHCFAPANRGWHLRCLLGRSPPETPDRFATDAPINHHHLRAAHASEQGTGCIPALTRHASTTQPPQYYATAQQGRRAATPQKPEHAAADLQPNPQPLNPTLTGHLQLIRFSSAPPGRPPTDPNPTPNINNQRPTTQTRRRDQQQRAWHQPINPPAVNLPPAAQQLDAPPHYAPRPHPRPRNSGPANQPPRLDEHFAPSTVPTHPRASPPTPRWRIQRFAPRAHQHRPRPSGRNRAPGFAPSEFTLRAAKDSGTRLHLRAAATRGPPARRQPAAANRHENLAIQEWPFCSHLPGCTTHPGLWEHFAPPHGRPAAATKCLLAIRHFAPVQHTDTQPRLNSLAGATPPRPDTPPEQSTSPPP